MFVSQPKVGNGGGAKAEDVFEGSGALPNKILADGSLGSEGRTPRGKLRMSQLHESDGNVLQSFNCLRFALIGVLCIQPCAQAQQPPTTSHSYVSSEVPDTPAGLQSQVDELVRIGKTHDQTN